MNIDTSPTSARYQHDCSSCTFLGQHFNFDLYFCKSTFEDTVIARRSNGGPDYSSGMAFSYGAIAELTVAREHAQTAGLCEYNLRDALRHMSHRASQATLDELKTHLVESDIGKALVLLASDVEAGTAAIRAYVESGALVYKRRFADKDTSELKDWARGHVDNARHWARNFGLPHAEEARYTTALYS